MGYPWVPLGEAIRVEALGRVPGTHKVTTRAAVRVRDLDLGGRLREPFRAFFGRPCSVHWCVAGLTQPCCPGISHTRCARPLLVEWGLRGLRRHAGAPCMVLDLPVIGVPHGFAVPLHDDGLLLRGGCWRWRGYYGRHLRGVLRHGDLLGHREVRCGIHRTLAPQRLASTHRLAPSLTRPDHCLFRVRLSLGCVAPPGA